MENNNKLSSVVLKRSETIYKIGILLIVLGLILNVTANIGLRRELKSKDVIIKEKDNVTQECMEQIQECMKQIKIAIKNTQDCQKYLYESG